eukprot:753036-Hanusia_phi.AAC.1
MNSWNLTQAEGKQKQPQAVVYASETRGRSRRRVEKNKEEQRGSRKVASRRRVEKNKGNSAARGRLHQRAGADADGGDKRRGGRHELLTKGGGGRSLGGYVGKGGRVKRKQGLQGLGAWNGGPGVMKRLDGRIQWGIDILYSRGSRMKICTGVGFMIFDYDNTGSE